LTQLLQAQAAYQCPAESLKVEFVSPVTKGRIINCVYEKDGQTIKHGQQWTFDSSERLMKVSEFSHGNEKTAGLSLPGAEESRQENINEVAMSDIMEIVRVLTLKQVEVREKFFKVNHCDHNAEAWIMAALMKQSLKRSYQFSENCDVQGDFVVSFAEEFPMILKLRHLKEFTATSMKIKLLISRKGNDIVFAAHVSEGVVTSPKNKVEFKANYEMQISPISQAVLPGSQHGKITLIQVNQGPVNITRDINFEK
jgi:hypothetical protein